MLPLFPLGTVLFPGLVLPLHVFEQRYRDLVRDLLALPEHERLFGVIAIRQGREVGADGVSALYAVGCAARLTDVEGHPDGTYDVVTVGARPFRLDELHQPDAEHAYLRGSVTWLPDEVGDATEASVLGPAVRRAFDGYLEAMAGATGSEIDAPDLPDEPLVLSHLVGATVLLDLQERQALLDQPDGVARLRRELTVLTREAGFLQVLGAAPAPDLARSPYSPN